MPLNTIALLRARPTPLGTLSSTPPMSSRKQSARPHTKQGSSLQESSCSASTHGLAGLPMGWFARGRCAIDSCLRHLHDVFQYEYEDCCRVRVRRRSQSLTCPTHLVVSIVRMETHVDCRRQSDLHSTPQPHDALHRSPAHQGSCAWKGSLQTSGSPARNETWQSSMGKPGGSTADRLHDSQCLSHAVRRPTAAGLGPAFEVHPFPGLRRHRSGCTPSVPHPSLPAGARSRAP